MVLPRNRFTRAVESFAARHQRIKPYTPKHNGKVERYQQTLAREVLYAAAYDSEQQRRDRITTWLIHYNYHRPPTAPQTATTSLTPGDHRHQRHAQLHLVVGFQDRSVGSPRSLSGECRGLRPRLRQAVICFCRCEGTF
ncbi:transposase (plasmid) [Dermacoccus abyssi]|uniref:Transposase n=1 Tax=Dermacoccus abyssi TaxID=322596 RepID=A0ABX5ZCU0_9MICO|nr:transposase [Dermacoccus abyssi]